MRMAIALLAIFFLSIGTVRAETINFDDVLDRSMKHSYDLKMSEYDIKISKESIREARADYFPIITTGLNTEYTRDLDNSSQVSIVGSTIIPSNTKYQDSLSVGAQYRLYDFGARGKRLQIAKKDVSQKQHIYSQSLRDLKVKTTDIYAEALLAYKELCTKRSVLSIYREILAMKERLFQSGTISKVDVADAAISVTRTLDDIDRINLKLKNSLEDLSYFTGENYSSDIKMENFPDSNNFQPVSLKVGIESNNIRMEDSPEFKIYTLEIEKKKAELVAIKRERLPQMNLYTNYYLYGANKDNIFSAYGDLSQRSASFGVSTQWQLFDGFRTSAKIHTLELEIMKLEAQRDQKTAEFNNEYQKLAITNELSSAIVKNQRELLARVEEKLSMLDRLSKEQLTDKPTLLTEKIEYLNQKLNIEQSITNKLAAERKLKFMQEGTK